MTRAGLRGLPLVMASAIATAGCGASVPVPPTGPHVDEEPAVVPYPPPAGRVEVIGAPPKELKKPVWVDGQWLWKGRRWVWQEGLWTDLPANSYYAPPAAVRLSDGTLVYFEGKWKAQKKR